MSDYHYCCEEFESYLDEIETGLGTVSICFVQNEEGYWVVEGVDEDTGDSGVLIPFISYCPFCGQPLE